MAGSLATMVPGLSSAVADTIFEVEHARANPRAGRPVSESDAELLNRWGALSGTPDWRRHASSYYEQDRPIGTSRGKERRRERN